jgi:hypothetical protein
MSHMMEHQSQRTRSQGPQHSRPGPPSIGKKPSDGLRKLATDIGNRQFSAAVVARDARSAPIQQQATPGWTVAGWGLATQTAQARIMCWRIDSEARNLEGAGFDRFGVLADEARSWSNALSGDIRALTSDEARQLTDFGHDFTTEREKAIRILVDSLVRQLSQWLKAQPISDEDLFDMRETVHHQFARGADTDVIAKSVELISTVHGLIKEVEKWAGRAAKAKYMIEQAKQLEDIHKGIKEISGKVGDAKKIVELVRNIGKMTGALGKTPSGLDDIGALEGTLDAMDFVISKLQVPGFKQFWDGYIYKATKLCLSQLRALKEQLYKGDRQGGVRLFFQENSAAPSAPDIRKAYFHGIDPAQHFPGGQLMLNFMWSLMKDPESVRSVPAAVEDFFVEWRDQMNAGSGEQLESDDSIGNLWNAFSRERAPNIVGWVRRNRNDVWVKLYGGMPAPQ